MNSQIFERARQYAEDRLKRELSPNLLYHGIVHTREEVVPAAEMLAGMEGVHGESLYLLLTAAWFHDLGYIKRPVDNESVGAGIAAHVLPGYGFTWEQVEIIRRTILATALPQTPTNLLGEILADADLEVLGSDDFMLRNRDLRRELVFFGQEYTDSEWYMRQIKFVESHEYFTDSARKLWSAGKVKNVITLRNRLAKIN